MTSTSVKDVGSVLNTLGISMGTGIKAVGNGGFEMVFSGQARKGAADSRTENVQAMAKKTPGDSLKAKDDHMARVSEKKSADSTEVEEEIPDEKLEQIMEVLGTAALDMMQQIADTFGVSAEELQSAMEELGMEGLDVLDQEQLATLLLKLAGAEDTYALVTDGELYGSYQEVMSKLEDVLGQVSEELDLEPEQLQDVVRQLQALEIPEEPVETEVSIAEETVGTVPVEVLEETPEEPERSEEPLQNNELSYQPMQQPQEADESPRENMEQQSESRGRHSQGRENPSLFAQTFQSDILNQFRTELQQTQGASNSWGTDTQNIMRQIMDYMRIQVKADTSSLEMQLHPESLGTLHIQVASKGGVLTANFITQNEAVKAALESQMVQLRESFEQQGVKVEAIEVTVQSHAFERNLEQGRGQSGEQSQPERRTRTRRINLDDSLEVENLEEEDALAAEMMAASGSQVDYTI